MSASKNQIYKIKPKCKYRTWGGNRLEKLCVEICGDPIGEVSLLAYVEINEHEKLKPLSDFYSQNKDLFKLNNDHFPLAINLIDAKEALSIQLHPNDNTAHRLGFDRGLCESWYVLDALEDATICYGHKAKSIDEFKEMVHKKEWSKLINKKTIKKDDYVYIPSGCLHAIESNQLIYEITHDMDITYRLYDYDRMDKKTHNLRELQLSDVYKNVIVPMKDVENNIKIMEDVNIKIITFIDELFKFTLKKIVINGSVKYFQENYYFYTVIEGNGFIQGREVKQYETFLVPQCINEVIFKGKMVILAASYKEG